MKLDYEEVKRYYDNGLLTSLLNSGGFTYRDVMDCVMTRLAHQESELETYDEVKDKLEIQLETAEHEVYCLREQVVELVDKVSELEDDYTKLNELYICS